MQEKSEYQLKIEKLARDVLVLSRNTLLVNLRFLDAALSQFEYIPYYSGSMCTDGRNLFYNPQDTLIYYKSEKEIVTRDYLHLVFHCIFRHMFTGQNIQRNLWDLACDISVEYAITKLGLKSTKSKREKAQLPYYETLGNEIGKLTTEKIYRYYQDKGIDDNEIARIQSLFIADSHSPWYMSATQYKESFGELSKIGGDKEAWEDISERMQMDLETFSNRKGEGAEGLIQNLKAVNRQKYDYTEFLKKFAVRGEVMKINDEEFDYIFYTYGLKLYEKMPLIEPLEFKEVKRIRDFVIAIDTSGSVKGDEVQAFVEKTYNVLMSTESFFAKINLHILQCDAKIQEHVKITSKEEFDEYLNTMELKGFGGTDFRPVFEKVDELVKSREINNLKGLIYFTDGYGDFPAKKPAYDTAFVFIEEDYEDPDVPPWVIKLVLQKDEI